MPLQTNGFIAVFCAMLIAANPLRLCGDVVHKDLCAYACEQRSDLVALDYDIQQDIQKENIALSGLFPTAQIIANKQGQSGDVWPDQQITLSIQTSIYEPAGPMARWWLAQTVTDLAKFTRKDQIDSVRFEVGNTFLSYRNEIHKNSLIQRLDASSQTRFAKARVAHAAGLLSTVEFEQERATFENLQRRVKEYINGVSIAREHLAFASEQPIIGRLADFSSEPLYDHVIQWLNPTVPGELVSQALIFRKELAIIDQHIAAAKIKKDIARYSYIPTIRFLVDLSRLSRPDIMAIVSTSPYRFGLEFGWSFDLGNLFSFRSAEAERLKNVFNRKRMEFSIENEVRTNYNELEIISKEIVAIRSKCDEARITFERNKKAHEIGTISDVEFKNAETEWEQVQFNLEDAITRSIQKHEELLWSTGYPKEQVTCFDLIEKTV